MSRALTAFPVGSLLVFTAIAIAGGCSVKLDLTLLDKDGGTGGNADGATDGGGNSDGAADSGSSIIQSCGSDTDCVAPNGCYKGRCDPIGKSCVFELCPQATACTAAACDQATFTCGTTAAPYKFRTVSFGVPGASLGCGLDAQSCVAAAFPFVLVGTTAGVKAYQVSDVTSTAPPVVPIEGLSFTPAHIYASGRRIWFLGAVEGAAAPYTLKVAWLDVPSDPTVKKLAATSVALSYPVADAVGFPAPGNGLYVAFQDAARKFPVVTFKAPLQEGGRVDLAPAGPETTYTMFTSSDAPTPFVAASATRLLTWTNDRTFSIENNVGTANAQNAAAGTAVLDEAPNFGLRSQSFASGPDGSVLWLATYAVCPGCGSGARTRMTWLVPDAQATAVTSTPNVVVEGSNGHSTTGPIAWLDPKRALVLATVPGAGTSVQVTSRDVGLVSGRRFILAQTVGTDHIAATSSNAYGYTVTSDGAGNDLNVSIYDPNCQ